MVYVDDYNARFRGMVMCHMAADTSEELLAMADAIGVKRKWIQYPGTPKEHFDICQSKRALALQNGAKEISVREMAMLVDKKKAMA